MYNNKVVDEEPNAMEKKRPKKKQDKDLEKKIPYFKIFPNEFIFNYIKK
jgi:hypothetical protein